uniref:Uncharacterized protein n=1 Tax=Wuchereria bancrofti TaxID=6293 RepID=A0AAF5Q750_WUCBA
MLTGSRTHLQLYHMYKLFLGQCVASVNVSSSMRCRLRINNGLTNYSKHLMCNKYFFDFPTAKVVGREGNNLLNLFELSMFPIRLAKVNVDYAADVAMDYDAFCSEIRSSCCTFEGVKTDDELDCFIDSIIDSE